MKLSEMLKNIPEDKQYTVYRKVKAAIREGTLSAVPVFEEMTIFRQNKPLEVLDHYIITNPDTLRAWYKGVMQPAGKRKTGAARFAVQDPTKMSPEELQKRADEYRASLSKPTTKRKAKK